METRQKSWKWGVWAERFGALFLQLKGYKVKARRYKTPVGEVDLIVRKGPTLVAVEVKARGTLEAGLRSVTPRQQQRICRSLEIYLTHHPQDARSDLRFDLIVVKPWAWPYHIQNAWESI